MINFIAEYKKYFLNKNFIWSCFWGFGLLVLGLLSYFWTAVYATEKQSGAVTDIILSNIPIFNVANIFVYGIFAVIAFVIFLALIQPKRFPFMVKSTAVFLLIRSVFVSMTHIGLYPHVINTTSDLLKSMTSGGDLFFSGHTGFPFLMALIFWKNKKLRYIFLALSIFFGVIALLGHYHYTIDVLSAFFITFGIYNICLKLFKNDYKLFL